MASLLSMLNNFLDSAGKPSLFNPDTTNTSQSTDFKNIVAKLLNSGDGDAQSLAGLMTDQSDGAGLPLLDAAGNVLPAQQLTAAFTDEASAQLPDAALTASASGAGDSDAIGLQTSVAATGGAQSATQPALTGLAVIASPEASMPIDVPLTTLVNGGSDLGGEQNSALQVAIESTPLPPGGEPMASTAEGNTAATQQAGSSVVEPATLFTQAQAQAQIQAQTQVVDAAEVPAGATAAMATLTTDGKPLLGTTTDTGTSITAPANTSITTAATNTAATPAAQFATQNLGQPASPLAAAEVPGLVAKDPQQFVLEQALGNEAGSDTDAPADLTRQSLVPLSPTLRAAPTIAAPLPTTDPNFANVANMLNQGQSMNSLNDRLQLMLLNGQNSAEIRLDPPELGSLQVRVTTRHEQTSVIFVAPNNAVRDALEQQLPRLRETLENAGLQLQDANVFAQTEDRPGSQPQSYADVEATEHMLADELEEAASSARGPRVSSQLVDAYI